MNRFTRGIAMASARHPWRTIASWVLLMAGVFFLAGAAGGTFTDDFSAHGQPERPRDGAARRELPRGGQGDGAWSSSPPRTARRSRRTARTSPRSSPTSPTVEHVESVGRPVRGRHDLRGRPDRLRPAHAGRTGARDREAGVHGALRGRLRGRGRGDAGRARRRRRVPQGRGRHRPRRDRAPGRAPRPGRRVRHPGDRRRADRARARRGRRRHRRHHAAGRGRWTCRPSAIPVAGLVGLGVGVDYALFIVARYRENRASGQDNQHARSPTPWAPRERPWSSPAARSSSPPRPSRSPASASSPRSVSPPR